MDVEAHEHSIPRFPLQRSGNDLKAKALSPDIYNMAYVKHLGDNHPRAYFRIGEYRMDTTPYTCCTITI